MGQVLHGGATTTQAVRRAIQDSQASLRALARRYGVNPKTIAKWRKAVPYDIRIVLTDNGIQFADLPKNRNGPTARFRGHPFDRACQRHDIKHRLTKPNHPWTNGQVERMNRTIKGRPSNASSTTPMTSCAVISTTSSRPTTSPVASRPSRVSRHPNTSAAYGPVTLTGSESIQTNKCRD